MTQPAVPPSSVATVKAGAGPDAAYVTLPAAPLRRPSLGRFIWYCYGGSVPAENHSWVLHDLTCRTWVARHFSRWTMVIAPLLVIYLVVAPIPLGVRLFTGVTFSLALYLMALVFILIDTDRRAVRAGYDYSQPSAVRTANSVERQRSANHQRRERIAARRAARYSK